MVPVLNTPPIGRVYRMNWLFRLFSLFFLVFGCFLLFGIARRLVLSNVEPNTLEILVSVVFPLAGSGMTVHAFMTRLSFNPNGVEKTSFLGRRSLPYTSIRGRREYVVSSGDPPGSTRYLKLEPNDSHPAIEFGKKLYTLDESFWQWFHSLPDLDAMDKIEHKDSNFGLV